MERPGVKGASIAHIRMRLGLSSPWARGGRRYHLREPHFNGTMLFRNMNCIFFFFLLDIPNPQHKPANLHKQNGRRPKRVCHISTIVHAPHTPPPPPGMYETYFILFLGLV